MMFALAAMLVGAPLALAQATPVDARPVVYAAHGQPAHKKHVVPAAPDAPYGRAGAASRISKIVELTATEMAFDRDEVRVRRGETVKFVLANAGAIAHEITIGDEATQSRHRRLMAAGGHGAAHAHANAVEAAPGAREALVWEFTRPGRFQFACNLPGHAEAGMVGAIVVE